MDFTEVLSKSEATGEWEGDSLVHVLIQRAACEKYTRSWRTLKFFWCMQSRLERCPETRQVARESPLNRLDGNRQRPSLIANQKSPQPNRLGRPIRPGSAGDMRCWARVTLGGM